MPQRPPLGTRKLLAGVQPGRKSSSRQKPVDLSRRGGHPCIASARHESEVAASHLSLDECAAHQERLQLFGLCRNFDHQDAEPVRAMTSDVELEPSDRRVDQSVKQLAMLAPVDEFDPRRRDLGYPVSVLILPRGEATTRSPPDSLFAKAATSNASSSA